jgi:iodotyrosine deiodinase
MTESTSGEGQSVYPFVPLRFERWSEDEALRRSRVFLASMRARRTIRAFSTEPVPFELIENAIATAATAPSGANQQPWRFVVVRDPNLKRRFPDEWRSALAPLGTDWHKEFLEIAPYLIVVFKEEYGLHVDDGSAQAEARRIKHYYVNESVGIALGFLIASLHQAGLATLTHTPNPMGFLRELLGRPMNEKPYVVLPVGYPAPDCRVPVLTKKSLDHVMIVK